MVVSYPVFLPAPVNAEFALVMRGLAAKAREAHRAPQKGLVMRRPAMPDTGSDAAGRAAPDAQPAGPSGGLKDRGKGP